jgi:hypothetical protein
MSSVTSAGLAQIPRNSYFRCIPALTSAAAVSTSIFTFNATSGVAPVLTNTSGGATGNFSLAPWISTTSGNNPWGAISSGQGLFKDMGDTIVSAGRTFRRVQLMNFSTATEQQAGTYSGVDSDANCGYIEVGFRGASFSPYPYIGPFVRAF